jgi:hypothetical protein
MPGGGYLESAAGNRLYVCQCMMLVLAIAIAIAIAITIIVVVVVFAGLTPFHPTQKHMPTDLLITRYPRGSMFLHGSRPGLGMYHPSRGFHNLAHVFLSILVLEKKEIDPSKHQLEPSITSMSTNTSPYLLRDNPSSLRYEHDNMADPMADSRDGARMRPDCERVVKSTCIWRTGSE